MKQAGIDKIVLTTTDVKPYNLADRQIWGKNANIKQGGGELPIYSDLEGNIEEANAFYHNSAKTGANYSYNQKGVSIQFNPSKKLHPFNLISTGKELNNYIKAIEQEAKEIMSVDFGNMNLCRFDLAKNREMSQPVSIYHSGLRLLKGRRADSREQPNSYYIGNKSHTTTFYNKKEQLLNYNINAITPEFFMRGEARFLTTNSVSRYTGIKTLNQLINASTEDLEQSYKTYLNKLCFSRANVGEQMRIDFTDDIELFNKLKSQKAKGYFNYWLQVMSIDKIMEQFGSIEMLGLFLREAGENRQNIHRHISKVRELIHLKGFIDSRKNKVTDVALLEEIREKFAA